MDECLLWTHSPHFTHSGQSVVIIAGIDANGQQQMKSRFEVR